MNLDWPSSSVDAVDSNRTSTMRVGIVGTGNMAREHARVFGHTGQVVGVVGRTESSAHTFAQANGIGYSSTSISGLVHSCQPDLIVIAVPELALPEVLHEALRQPAALLVEKPIGKNLAEASRLAHSVSQFGAHAYVAMNRRHYASSRWALQSLRELDDAPRLIQVLDQEDQRAARASGQPEVIVRNWMYANSIHLVDLIRFLSRGSVDKVDIVSPWNPERPGFVAAFVSFSSGDVAMYEATWNGPGPWSCSVSAGPVRFEMRPLEVLGLQLDGHRELHAVELDEADRIFKPGLLVQAQECLRMIHGEAHALPDFNETLESVRLVSQLYGLDDVGGAG